MAEYINKKKSHAVCLQIISKTDPFVETFLSIRIKGKSKPQFCRMISRILHLLTPTDFMWIVYGLFFMLRTIVALPVLAKTSPLHTQNNNKTKQTNKQDHSNKNKEIKQGKWIYAVYF